MDMQRYDVVMYGSPPWGFRLAGGADFYQEISINRVTPGSLAHQHGVRDGDTLIAIDGHSTGGLTQLDVQNMIKQIGARGQLRLSLQKNSPNAWRPNTNVNQSYVAANQPSDTASRFNRQSLSSHGGGPTGVTAGNPQVQHLQYNSPMGLYSTNNAYESLRQQTQGYTNDGHLLTIGSQVTNALHQPRGNESTPLRDFTQSDAYRALQLEESGQEQQSSYKTFSSISSFQPRDVSASSPHSPATEFVQSRSFRRLQRETEIADSSPHSASRFSMGGNSAAASGSAAPNSDVIRPVQAPTSGPPQYTAAGPSPNSGPFTRTDGTPRSDGHVVTNAKPYASMPCPQMRQMNGGSGSGPKPGSAPVASRSYGGDNVVGNGGAPAGNSYIPPTHPNQSNTPTDYFNAVPGGGGYSAPGAKWTPPSSGLRNQQQGKKPSIGSGPAAARQNIQSAMPKSFGGKPLSLNTSNDLQPTVPADSSATGSISPPGGGASHRSPTCQACMEIIRGPFVTAVGKNWHPEHFKCTICGTSLQDQGFVQDDSTGQLLCEKCYNTQFAPVCYRCSGRIVGDVLHAIEKTWHAECFVCTHCKEPFGSAGFHLEEGMPYCENDWNELFTSKCDGCQKPIQAGHRWLEALNVNWHAECFKCATCLKRLEGETFFSKSGRPYCREHNR